MCHSHLQTAFPLSVHDMPPLLTYQHQWSLLELLPHMPHLFPFSKVAQKRVTEVQLSCCCKGPCTGRTKCQGAQDLGEVLYPNGAIAIAALWAPRNNLMYQHLHFCFSHERWSTCFSSKWSFSLLQGDPWRVLQASSTLSKLLLRPTRYIKLFLGAPQCHDHYGPIGTHFSAPVPIPAATYRGPNTRVGLWEPLS